MAQTLPPVAHFPALVEAGRTVPEVLLQEVEGGLPLAEAAAILGVSERTLRKRIKAGVVKAVKVVAPNGGAAFRVFLDESVLVPAVERAEPEGFRPELEASVPPVDVPVPVVDGTEVLQLLREKDQLLLELSGRLGFYQARIQELERRVLELEGPKESPAEMATHPTPPENVAKAGSDSEKGSARPWWKFW